MSGQNDPLWINPQLPGVLKGPDRHVVTFLKSLGKGMLRGHPVVHIQRLHAQDTGKLAAKQLVIVCPFPDESASVKINNQGNPLSPALPACQVTFRVPHPGGNQKLLHVYRPGRQLFRRNNCVCHMLSRLLSHTNHFFPAWFLNHDPSPSVLLYKLNLTFALIFVKYSFSIR